MATPPFHALEPQRRILKPLAFLHVGSDYPGQIGHLDAIWLYAGGARVENPTFAPEEKGALKRSALPLTDPAVLLGVGSSGPPSQLSRTQPSPTWLCCTGITALETPPAWRAAGWGTPVTGEPHAPCGAHFRALNGSHQTYPPQERDQASLSTRKSPAALRSLCLITVGNRRVTGWWMTPAVE